MADIIVQPKVLNADGVTYDSLIMQNAVNAIKKDDNSGYNGLTQNVTSGAISTTDGYKIEKRINIFHSDEGFTIDSSSVSSASWASADTSALVSVGDIIEISYKVILLNNTAVYKRDRFILREASSSDYTSSDSLFAIYTNEMLPTIGQKGYVRLGGGRIRFSLQNQKIEGTYCLSYQTSFSQTSTTVSSQTITIGNSSLVIYDVFKII